MHKGIHLPSFEDEVLEKVFELSAGYPEPVHLLSSQLLKTDTDRHLSMEDFRSAKIEVVETLRRNKLASMLENASSGKYQQILKAMANLKKHNIISQVDKGVYTFVDPLLKEYISRFGVIDT